MNVWVGSRGCYQFCDTDPFELIETSPDTEDLRWAIASLRQAIEDFALLADDWELRGGDEKEYQLKRLAEEGHHLFQTLLAGVDRKNDLRRIFAAADYIQAIDDQYIPWEFVYLEDLDKPVSLQHFVGAKTVVGRPFQREGETARANRDVSLFGQSPFASTAHQFPSCGLAQDNRLRSTRLGLEKAGLISCGLSVFDLDELDEIGKSRPWCIDKLRDFADAARLLMHFNCHASSPKPGASDKGPTLFVSRKFGLKTEEIGALPIRANSIVFLNCCDGMAIEWHPKTSLASAFAKKNIAAVVSTTARIPDLYATRWAKEFYAALLNGCSVGQAIAATKAAMLARDKNPAAFFYAIMGKYDACIRSELMSPSNSRAAGG